MRHWVKRFSVATLLSASCGGVFAGSSSGQITQLLVITGDVVIFTAGDHAGKPACSTVGNDWAVSLASVTGRAMYAVLLTAKAQGKTVTVTGNGNCSAWGDREAPYQIFLN